MRTPIKSVETNCRPASALEVGRQFGRAVPARPFVSGGSRSAASHTERIRHSLILVPALLAAALAGCAYSRDAHAQIQPQTNINRRGALLLSATNAMPGSTYDVGVYVITRGDTVFTIAQRFHISVADFMAINPELEPTRLVIGQTVRVCERMRE